MTQQNPLDQKGDLVNYPLAELLVEIGQAKFSGSLRLSRKQQKTVVYFDKGEVIFAVANAKPLRLFNVLLQNKKIDKKLLATHPSFANDLEFSVSLQANGDFSKEDVDAAFSMQIDAIMVDALTWVDGEWHFSPLARLRDDVRYETHLDQVLIDYARCIPTDVILKRFRSVHESFSVIKEHARRHILRAHEAHVLERFQNMSLNIAQLRGMTSLPENGLLQALYALWLGGVLRRRDWNAAFSAVKIGEILTARISKVKQAETLPETKPNAEAGPEPEPEPEKVTLLKPVEVTISLEEYLTRVESAETHYDTLGIDFESDATEVKQMYLGLAKRFHPDKYHRESEAIQKRVQTAFTELAHAYETLKTHQSRETYDLTMQKEILARDERRRTGRADDTIADKKNENALESFEKALIFLKNEEYDQAVGLLARAVHYSPDNPQFRAYYGQALSAFEGQDHKAEAEFQSAVKLAPKDGKIRMMLVDFLLEIDMKKRAVGELKRFLELVPSDKDAVRRLDKLSAST